MNRAVQSLLSRRYLLGAVLAWVLIVYLAAGPAAHAPFAGYTNPPIQPGGAATTSAPVAAAVQVAAGAVAPPPPSATAPPAVVGPPAPQLGGFGPPTFPASPPPPNIPQLKCPYPIPQAQTAPISPGVILSFESPLIELSGPYGAWDIPTLGAIAPVIPLVTPVLSISQPVLNEITPNESTIATDIVTLEAKLGLDSPENAKLAQEYEPDWLKFVYTFTPIEQVLASTTAAQCLALFGNALAQDAAQHPLQLPPLPTIPSGVPPAIGQAVLSETHAPFTTVVMPWSGGVPANAVSEVAKLARRGLPVLVELRDVPPAGQTTGGTGFADFVARAVNALPGASAFQVDGSAPAADVADVAHGLAAADFARRAGQLIGVGVPPAALGRGGPAFWAVLGAALRGFQANLVDFVAAPLGGTPALSAATARTLERDWYTYGGVPKAVPLFATVGAGNATTPAAARALIAGYEAALRPLGLGLLELRP